MTTIKYAPEEQTNTQQIEILSNVTQHTSPISMNEVKKRVPKLPEQTIQDSIPRLIQTIRSNHGVESQTGN